jgi:hypothetical protein
MNFDPRTEARNEEEDEMLELLKDVTGTLEKGDVIQIINEENKWFPCLLVVSEVKSWGIQAYVMLPKNDGTGTGFAYYRISYGEFVKIGSALIVAL